MNFLYKMQIDHLIANKYLPKHNITNNLLNQFYIFLSLKHQLYFYFAFSNRFGPSKNNRIIININVIKIIDSTK